MKTYKIRICLVLCFITTIIFTVKAVSSCRELPAGLSDMYGDTSGIRNLLIDALISDSNNKYSYTISLSRNDIKKDVHVYKSSEDVTQDLRISYPFSYSFIYPFEAFYIPIGETRSENTESENAFRQDQDGQWMPLLEYRIYAELFEVVPLMYAGNLPLALEPDKNRLFINPDEKGYIYVIDNNGEFENQRDYRPGFTIESSARLHSELAIGEKHLLVPTGKGFFGHTAVYIINIPGGHVPTVQAEGDNQVYIIADELYPIELERGDEILGFIELDSDVLLAVQRSGGFELTRIDLETGEGISVYTEGKAWLNKYYLTDDSLVLISNYWDYDYPDVHAFDLSNGGIERVMSVESADLWDNRSDGNYYEIKDVVLKSGELYAAVSKQSEMSGYGSGEVQITALAPTGELIGRCRLLCGIEEDYTQFWIMDRGSTQSGYVRELRSITLR